MVRYSKSKHEVPEGTKPVMVQHKVVQKRASSPFTKEELQKRKGKLTEENLGDFDVVSSEEVGMPPKREHITITAPNLKRAIFTIRGKPGIPVVWNQFGEKAVRKMQGEQELGSAEKKKRGKTMHSPKVFAECYENAKHKSVEGWEGFPATAIRAGMLSACKLMGFVMELAKLCVNVIPDGFDKDYVPLIKFTKGKPEMSIMPVRIGKGKAATADLRARPRYIGWEAKVTLEWDADQYNATDVTNLLLRVGSQVGIGEARPSAKNSGGLGWGLFDVII